MTILTLNEIKTELRAGLGGRTDLDTRLDGILNLTQTRIARLKDFDELRARDTIDTVVTGDPAVDKFVVFAGSDLARHRKIYSIRLYANNQMTRKLEKVLSSLWDKTIPEPEYYARGTPTHYTLWGKDEMELWRVPDIVYTMHFRFSRWPNLITGATSGGSYLDLENLDDCIIHLALSYCFLSLNHAEQSNHHYGIYRTLVKEAIGVEEEEYDLFQRSRSDDNFTSTRGYDDPFVKSIESD